MPKAGAGDLSADGSQVVYSPLFRFTVPIEKGPTRNLTNSSGAHDREGAWSPDGGRPFAIRADRRRL